MGFELRLTFEMLEVYACQEKREYQPVLVEHASCDSVVGESEEAFYDFAETLRWVFSHF